MGLHHTNTRYRVPIGLVGLAGLTAAVIGGLSARFYLGCRRAERMWTASRYPRFGEFGSVKHLTILPLIDWYSARDDLVGEAGVSYLIRADETTILFDLGLNERREHPSPLLRNMAALGVDMADIDLLVISHPHGDHMGGMSHQMRRTFALSGWPVDLRGMPAFVPATLSHSTAEVTVVDEPRILAPGVATMGPIARQDFFMGWTPEQSLAINVEGKGIVLVVGCGHPTIQRIVERAEMLFEQPFYGVVGGLHYPATKSRIDKFGVPLQRVLGTGKWPWDTIDQADVHAAIACLRRHTPHLVALSAHDSCDWSLGAFRGAFGEAYRDIMVGREIIV